MTNDQFAQFVNSTGYRTESEVGTEGQRGVRVWNGTSWNWNEQKTWRNVFSYSGRSPVVGVSWNDVIAYCKWLTEQERQSGRLPVDYEYGLPTEAQWEYACRAGTTTATAFGNSLSSRQANFNGNYPYGGASKGPYLERTSDVGNYQPNGWGFYDMHGNVWEWCHDWYGAYGGDVRDPTGPPSGSNRVVRGGSWNGDGGYCWSANRGGSTPSNRNSRAGFPCFPEKQAGIGRQELGMKWASWGWAETLEAGTAGDAFWPCPSGGHAGGFWKVITSLVYIVRKNDHCFECVLNCERVSEIMGGRVSRERIASWGEIY